MMKQPDWGMGTSFYKSSMVANSSGLKKKKTGSFNDLFLIFSIVIVFLNLTNIGKNTFFVAT